MKRLVILLFAVVTSAAMWAQAFTVDAKAYVDGALAGNSSTSVSVTKNGSLYNVTFNDLKAGSTAIGNVELKDVKSETVGSSVILMANQDVAIAEGTDPQPVKMIAAIEGGRLTARLTISSGKLYDIYMGDGVLKGTNYHVPNGDFEGWHTMAEGYIAPNAWHSIEDGTGTVIASAGHHLSRSANGHSGYCASIVTTARVVFGVTFPINGTMTTGRMNAESMAAADTQFNYAYLDMSMTDRDGNNDPFYVALTHKPDSLTLWMQFNQTAASNSPYCVVSGTITDGTRYQEPKPTAETQYTNVVCNARNPQIATTGGKWKRISIPFNYDNYTSFHAQPRAIMITVSTNAVTGTGSEGDEVLVDDLSLVYNCQLGYLGEVSGFAPNKYDYEVSKDINAASLKAIANGKEAHVLITEKPAADGKYIYVDVYSGDLMSRNTYTIHCKTGTGIAVTTKAEKPGVETYYNMGGQRISAPQRGQVTIVKTTDGRTFKTVAK